MEKAESPPHQWPSLHPLRRGSTAGDSAHHDQRNAGDGLKQSGFTAHDDGRDADRFSAP